LAGGGALSLVLTTAGAFFLAPSAPSAVLEAAVVAAAVALSSGGAIIWPTRARAEPTAKATPPPMSDILAPFCAEPSSSSRLLLDSRSERQPGGLIVLRSVALPQT
jgi:hypothetical protein